MKIIIAGAREVGTHLATLLSRDQQDIILIDQDKEHLETIEQKLNIMTYVGNPAQVEVLEDAGVKGADLFIAVNMCQHLNMNACMLASQLGAKRTVARVSHASYTNSTVENLLKNVGVDHVIYPEAIAAQEIGLAIRNGWCWQQIDLAKGLIRLAGIKIKEDAKRLFVTLKMLGEQYSNFQIVAIKRGTRTIMPRGKDRIEPGDFIYVTYLPAHEQELRELCAKRTHEIDRILILGATPMALMTAKELKTDHEVRILDSNMERIEEMMHELDDVVFLHHDVSNGEAIQEEDVAAVDAFIALSDGAEENILACRAAKNLGVKRAIAEVENINYIQIAEGLSIGTVINKKKIAASQIYEMLYQEKAQKVRCLTYSDAEVIEIKAKDGSKITRRAVKDLNLPQEIRLGGLVRSGVPMLVDGDTQICAHDTVVVFFDGAAISKIDKYFA